MSAFSFRFPTQTQHAFLSYWKTQVISTAIRLDIFTPMDLAPMSVNTLGAKMGCSPRGTAALLDGLVALGLVNRDDKGLYRLTDESSHFLVKGKPDYIG